MRHTAAITAALLLAALTAGCSSDSHGPTVSKATDTPAPVSSSPSSSPSPSEETYKLGDSINISNAGIDFTVTALSFKDEGISSLPGLLSAGEKWAVVEVKVCNTGSQVFSVSPFPWSLAYEDGARVQATGVSGAELPAPEYPVDAKAPGGDCVRGNIPFEVPKSGRAERVLYGPEDLEEPVEWTVPKA
ncbi:DUF4352 domain-containing protein [Streptomyces sp. NPDC093568]|uniref:DUF4352 domain-containing protein n=1 Tax=Streptomyces sp. NPDC093568 TaxID=3366041 RepID=UPI00381F433B